ncbi:hypothetical protein DFH11DRAFT_610582 [Phellopilus nigrolimitatus]|nr:hypothetical protein DFH11DRAFT_610582 [Phellopilus nigrolimitatus]
MAANAKDTCPSKLVRCDECHPSSICALPRSNRACPSANVIQRNVVVQHYINLPSLLLSEHQSTDLLTEQQQQQQQQQQRPTREIMSSQEQLDRDCSFLIFGTESPGDGKRKIWFAEADKWGLCRLYNFKREYGSIQLHNSELKGADVAGLRADPSVGLHRAVKFRKGTNKFNFKWVTPYFDFPVFTNRIGNLSNNVLEVLIKNAALDYGDEPHTTGPRIKTLEQVVQDSIN